MRKNGKNITEGEEAFARAWYDVVQDMEVGLGVLVSTQIGRTKRKGVLSIEMVAVLIGADSEVNALSRVVEEWPNARAGTLGAQLFSMSNKLYVMAENVVKERGKPPAYP